MSVERSDYVRDGNKQGLKPQFIGRNSPSMLSGYSARVSISSHHTCTYEAPLSFGTQNRTERVAARESNALTERFMSSML